MSTEQKKPLFGYWDFRGLAQPVNLLCHYLGVDYDQKRYSKGSDLSGDEWFQEKFVLGLEFPNLPYWIDDDVKLTEARAILKYLARVHGNSQLIPLTAQSQAAADMVEGVVQDIYSEFMALLFVHTHIYIFRTTVPPEELTKFNQSTSPRLEQLDNFLEKRKWVAGDQLSYVDFYVYENLFQIKKWKTDFLDPFPTVQNYMQRFESLPKVAECIQATGNIYCLGVNAGF